MTIVAIHQPGYFPWIGVIDKIARADVFVLLDNVQFNRAAYQHRTLYSATGEPKLLTLPVKKAGFLEAGLQIRDVQLADLRAPAKHFETLRGRYRKTPGWGAWEARLREVLSSGSGRLMDYAVPTLKMTLDALGITTRIVPASQLDCSGRKADLVMDLVKAVNGNVYLSGAGARDYQSPERFSAVGIELVYQNLKHPRWSQSQSGDFQPGCFALEWAIEEGSAASAFGQYLKDSAAHAFLAADKLPSHEVSE